MAEQVDADGFVTVDRRKRMRPASSVDDVSVVLNDVLRIEKVPPIVVSVGNDWHKLLKDLKETTAFFEAKFVGKRLHLLCSSPNSFRVVQNFLAQRNILFHTFALKEEAELKTVIRGLPAGTPEEDIKLALEDLGFSPTVITPLERRARLEFQLTRC
jgi:hypothetical protein